MITVIHGGTIVNEGKRFIGYIAYCDGVITDVGELPLPDKYKSQDCTLIDASGCYVLPGVIDTHVHFRDGGNALSPKGNITSESNAAMAGGVTSCFDMPNTVPQTVTLDAWRKKMEHAKIASKVNYAFFLGAANDNIEELKRADYSSIPGIKLFMGASTGNMLVDNNDALDELFREFRDRVIAVHAENQTIIEANKKRLIARYGTEDLPVSLHSALRSREACVTSAEKAVSLAKKYNSRLHLLHISTADELLLLTGGDVSDKRITAETCPHYLYFTEDDYSRLGARIKCNPAIKTAADRDALIKAISDGRIDVIATDHAPHLLSDKHGNAFSAASGMPGVQFSLPLMLELTRTHSELTMERVVELMSHNPAIIYSISRRGFLRTGNYADIVIVKEVPEYTVSDADVKSLCGWTPYAGMTLHYMVIKTIVNGGGNPEPVRF